MKRFFLIALIFSMYHTLAAQDIDSKIKQLISRMTLQEKIGQLNQYSADWNTTGPVIEGSSKIEDIKQGKVGSMLNVKGVEYTRKFQEAALQSRLKIPLLFGLDVIHGYRVTFPIPLAEAASWDLEAIEKSARVAATEAAAAGVHWTFAPMVDISTDPRWGRVMEGAGEDTYLGAKIAYARVKGFQGNGIGNTDAIMACAKHFIGYGEAIGGRDYNSVDMSLRKLWETHLPPFKAALDAGVATFMNSFNDLNGVPATGNSYLQREVLKGKWNFSGFVVSDWASVSEMVNHGYASDKKQAANFAINAGCDMDMESRSYINNLETLVNEGKVKESVIDEAVARVLRKKFELGLFDDPYKFSDANREKETLNKPEHILAARNMARKSIVLLKNENGLLPISKKSKTIALIGPNVKADFDLKGAWAIGWDNKDRPLSVFEALQSRAEDTELLYAQGCGISDTSKSGFREAIETAKKADVVILVLGEQAGMSGESKSRSDISIPGVQEELAKEIIATGKPVVSIIMAGRPLVFNFIKDNSPAILYAWWLGTEAGNAISDVLLGQYNPSGKLPVTFPSSVGQIPVYYNYLNTGRPNNDKTSAYTTGYIDLVNKPAYPFGHGLSYTKFEYAQNSLSADKISAGDVVRISVDIKNTGSMHGEEVVQLYIQDVVAQPVRPVKELKGFEKVSLKPGETRAVEFEIDKSLLSFYDNQLNLILQPGTFRYMIGSSSEDIRVEGSFEVIE
ncbi:MAG: beta-glucosidase BglX [Draconibacterium sp.]